MKRRDLIFGSMGVAAFGVSEALRPRKRLLLLQGDTVANAMPITFPGWSSAATSNLVGPELSGRVMRAIYSEIVARIYYKGETDDGVMLLAAYGDTQSDLLQLHRPEFCYPAVGFNLREVRNDKLDIGNGAMLPIRRVVAAMDDSLENIVYWTRMGESLPESAGEQRAQRIENSIHGFIPDGILMRASYVGDPATSFAILDQFVPALLHAIPAARRKAFVGTRLANQMSQA